MKRQQSITLSGSVFLRTPAAPQPGDLVLLTQDDTQTRKIARKNNQFSKGFSGYLIAYIYDGDVWARLELWGVLPDNQLRYEYRYQSKHRIQAAVAPLQRLEGRMALRVEDDPYGRYMFALVP